MTNTASLSFLTFGDNFVAYTFYWATVYKERVVYQWRWVSWTCVESWNRTGCSDRFQRPGVLPFEWWARTGRCCAVCRPDSGDRLSPCVCRTRFEWPAIQTTTIHGNFRRLKIQAPSPSQSMADKQRKA